MKKNLKTLENKLGVSFKNIDLLKTSLVHRSYLNEHKDFTLDHNERLEFLGDAVLELVVTDYLFKNYNEAEGVLTNWRSSLVNSSQLAARSEELGIYNFLHLSRGEAQDTNKKARNYILANAYEAIIGAIYLDQGYDMAEEFITNSLIKELDRIIENKEYIDAKSMFQEKAQELIGITPYYRVLSESGPDHNKKFIIGVYLDKELIAKGEGYSKQEAQISAARKGIDIKGWT